MAAGWPGDSERHWRFAGEHERSLIAAWRGAGEAGSAWSYAEQLEMLELILELWPHLPDAGKVIGTTHLDVLEQAADAACWAAQPGRGMKLVEVALSKARELDDLDRVARLLLQRAPMRHQQVIPGQMDDLEAALRLSTRSPVLRIECLGQLCRAFLMQDRIEDAELQARELAELASVTGDEAARLDARLLRAMLDSRRGADTSTELETVSVLCGQRRCGWLEALAMNSLIESHVAVGRFELAIKVAAQAARRCIEVGQVGYLGASIAQNHARALQFVGRWDEAIVILEQALGVDPAPFGRAQLVLCRAEIAALCGDIETAKRDLFYLLTLPVELLARPLSILRLELEILLGEGDLPGAVLKASNVAGAKLGAAPQDAWPLLAQVVRIHIDTGKDAAALTPLLSAARHLPRTGPVEKAYADLVAAERSRTHEHAPLAPWHRAAETWAALGQPYQHAYALIRAAAIEPARGGASERLSEALALASRLGAEPLLKRIAVVAQRRRVHLQGADMMVQTGAPFSLTKREIEVLKLLAEGQTNRQIALSLVISVKTASVHVTNILSKLDVRTRGAAAAVAHRLGLTETI